jgi:hypothetical protein
MMCQERTSGAVSCSANSAAEHGESNGRVQKLTAGREDSDADLAGLDRGLMKTHEHGIAEAQKTDFVRRAILR